MTTAGTGHYQVTGWDEHVYDEEEGAVKVTRASIKNAFTGVVDGEGSAEMLMVYGSETAADFVGLQRLTGTIDGRKGSFVLQTTGTWQAGVAKADWFVLPGSATGELAGLTGTGGYVSGEDGACEITLEYDLG